MDSQFIVKPAIHLIGLGVRTTNAKEEGPEAQIPKLWETYYTKNMRTQIEATNADLLYAVYTNYESDFTGAYTFLIGHEFENTRLPGEQDWFRASIPEAKYMVFKTERGPVYEVVPQAWRHIWTFFQNTSDVMRRYSGDFELYRTSDFDPNDAEIEIFISVK